MTIRALAGRRFQHRAHVTRLELDESSLDTEYVERTVYRDLPCLMLRVSDRAMRDEDRQIGVSMYRLLHLEGTLAVNDRVTVTKNGDVLQDGMFSGPTATGLAVNRTEIKSVAYGLP